MSPPLDATNNAPRREGAAPRAARRASSCCLASATACTPLTLAKCSKPTSAPTSACSLPRLVCARLYKVPLQSGLHAHAELRAKLHENHDWCATAATGESQLIFVRHAFNN